LDAESAESGAQAGPDITLRLNGPRALRGRPEGSSRAYPTFYAYGSVDALVRDAQAAGLQFEGLVQTSFLLGYLARWRPLAPLGKAWDGGVNRLGWRSMQDHACLTLRKAGHPTADCS
jgi:hypothetical protein